MKYLTLAAVSIMTATLATTAIAAKSPFKNDKQKLSYTLGYKSGLTLKQQQAEIQEKTFVKGLQAAFRGNKPALSADEMNRVIMDFKRKLIGQQIKKIKALADDNAAKAAAFLKENAKVKGVKQLGPDLQYKVIEQGKGPMPKATDMVTVHYEGKLLDGKVFDSSFKRGSPATLQLNRVIPGWTKALTKMPVGSTWMLYIGPKDGYGPQGSPPVIPPNSLLQFKVKLIKAEPAPAPKKK